MTMYSVVERSANQSLSKLYTKAIGYPEIRLAAADLIFKKRSDPDPISVFIIRSDPDPVPVFVISSDPYPLLVFDIRFDPL